MERLEKGGGHWPRASQRAPCAKVGGARRLFAIAFFTCALGYGSLIIPRPPFISERAKLFSPEIAIYIQDPGSSCWPMARNLRVSALAWACSIWRWVGLMAIDFPNFPTHEGLHNAARYWECLSRRRLPPHLPIGVGVKEGCVFQMGPSMSRILSQIPICRQRRNPTPPRDTSLPWKSQPLLF